MTNKKPLLNDTLTVKETLDAEASLEGVEALDAETTAKKPILEVRNVKKYFKNRSGVLSKAKNDVMAVDGVSFDLYEGETLGIVGESGCGKSTLARAILGLFDDVKGSVKYNGKELVGLSPRLRRKLSPELQMIFQDPYSSLNPRITCGKIIEEPLINNGLAKDAAKTKERVLQAMRECGLSDYHIVRYPHEFSGGQRQRIGIARALVLDPKIVICDEAVSALDVSIQAQIINLLMNLQEERGLSYIFISHDLSVVEHISTRVGVMYLGNFVELTTKEKLYESPLHPYTRALLSAAPVPDPTVKNERQILEGDLPSPANPPSGCKFHTRCPYATELCSQVEPAFEEKTEGHFVACHYVTKEGEFTGVEHEVEAPITLSE